MKMIMDENRIPFNDRNFNIKIVTFCTRQNQGAKWISCNNCTECIDHDSDSDSDSDSDFWSYHKSI